MYLILHANIDPFCGGDFTFCTTKKELVKEINFIGKESIFAIYNLKGKKNIKHYYLTY